MTCEQWYIFFIALALLVCYYETIAFFYLNSFFHQDICVLFLFYWFYFMCIYCRLMMLYVNSFFVMLSLHFLILQSRFLSSILF